MDRSLPETLEERCRWLIDPDQASGEAGELVLYWMHGAMRAHENPALDVAMRLAEQNGLPLLVYMGLSEDYPYASDRLHTFILQGQRDVLAQLRSRGVSTACFVARQGHRGRHLRDLVNRSAVLVSEEMPAQPIADWVDRLKRRCRTPIVMVDSSCVVPLSRFDSAPDQPSEFRKRSSAEYHQTLSRPYQEQDVECAPYTGSLPFESVPLEDVCLARLLSTCRIDHSIPPVADTPGGSKAGYRRWDVFCRDHLPGYHERRCDAADWKASSRMSAYLHFGMVSPFRIGRDALAIAKQHDQDATAASPNGGLPREGVAAKFLDQFLVWREMAFHYCAHHIDQIDSLDAIPEWSRQTLRQHSKDRRLAHLSWERLARGQTGFPVWDLFQRSLIRHGELHNNARMSWCKGLLELTSTPDRAFHFALDLNHRFALDGRSPSSHGGVLWCFGGFDCPREEEQPVFGKLRPRGLDMAQKKIDKDVFAKRVERPIARQLPKIAVVGAGMGGLIAARTLADVGLDVTVFDKSRGVGGRLSTRRARLEQGQDVFFDHGAQYFTARDFRFQRYVRSWMDEGLVQAWMGRIVELAPGGHIVEEKMRVPRYVGVPSMNAIAKHLGNTLHVQTQQTLQAIHPDSAGRWTLRFAEGAVFDGFDVVLFNPPPEQTAAIVGQHASWRAHLDGAVMQPCWATMAICETSRDVDFDAAFINEGLLSWVARNETKPRRSSVEGCQWTLHASPSWSAERLEQSPEAVGDEMIEALGQATGIEDWDVRFRQTHRWRYALGSSEVPEECLWDPVSGLGACGDWLAGGRVEGAFLSGQAVAGAVLRHYTVDRAAGNDVVVDSASGS